MSEILWSESNLDKLRNEEHVIVKVLEVATENNLNELFLQWVALREKIGEMLVHKALLAAAKACCCVFIINPVKKASFAQFLRPDTQSKRMGIQARTSSAGLCKGFISEENCPHDLLKLPLEFTIGKIKLKAVSNGKREYVCHDVNNAREGLVVAHYSNRRLVTSDLDIVLLVLREADNQIRNDSEFGQLSESEKKCILSANHHFQVIVDHYYPGQSPCRFSLFAHGPASRFSKSKQGHLHFPMNVYYPDQTVEQLGDESNREESLDRFKLLIKKLKNKGFAPHINDLWNLS